MENKLTDKLIVLDQPNTLTHVLWNFYHTEVLTISGTSVQGSILTPKANVTFMNGNINGSLAAYNLMGVLFIYFFIHFFLFFIFNRTYAMQQGNYSIIS